MRFVQSTARSEVTGDTGQASGSEVPARRGVERSGHCQSPVPSRPRPSAHHTRRKLSVLPEAVPPAPRNPVAFRRRRGRQPISGGLRSTPRREQPMMAQPSRKLFRPEGVSTDAQEATRG